METMEAAAAAAQGNAAPPAAPAAPAAAPAPAPTPPAVPAPPVRTETGALADAPGAPENPAPTLQELWDTGDIEWLEAQLDVLARTGVPVTKEEIAAIKDPEARRVVASMEAWRRHKEDEFAAKERELEGTRGDAEAKLRMATRERAEALGFVNSSGLKQWWDQQVAALPAKPPDPDHPDYPGYQGKLAGLNVLSSFLQTLDGEEKTLAGQRAEVERKTQAEATKTEMALYIDQHIDDFNDPELYKAIESLMQNHRLPLEKAHRMAVAERALADRDFAEIQAESREVSRRRTRTGGRTISVVPEVPQNLSMTERDEFYQNNPEAKARRLEEHRRNGTGY